MTALVNTCHLGLSDGTTLSPGSAGNTGSGGNYADAIAYGTVAATFDLSTVTARPGGSWRFTYATAAAYVAWNTQLGTMSVAGGRAYFTPDNVTAGYGLVRYLSGSAQSCRIDVSTTGNITLKNASNTVGATSTTVLTVGRTVRLEWSATFGATGASLSCRIFYSNPNSTTPDETLTISGQVFTATASEVQLGMYATASATVNISDVVVNNDGSYPGPAAGISHVASYTNGSTLGSQPTGRDVTLPASGPGGVPQPGDLVLLTYAYQGSGTANSVATPPAGTTVLTAEQDYNISSTAGGYATYYRFLDAGDVPGTTVYTNTWTFTSRFVEQCTIYRGVDPNTPFDVSLVITNTGTTGSTSKVIPAVTSVTDGALEVALIGAGGTALNTTAGSVSNAPGFTTPVTDGSHLGTSNVKNAFGAHEFRLLPTAGSYGTATATTTVATAGMIVAVVLRPLPAFSTYTAATALGSAVVLSAGGVRDQPGVASLGAPASLSVGGTITRQAAATLVAGLALVAAAQRTTTAAVAVSAPWTVAPSGQVGRFRNDGLVVSVAGTDVSAEDPAAWRMESGSPAYDPGSVGPSWYVVVDQYTGGFYLLDYDPVSPVSTGAADLRFAPSLVVSGRATYQASAAISAGVSLSAGAVRTQPASASLGAPVALSAGVVRGTPAAAVVNAAVFLTAGATRIQTGSAALLAGEVLLAAATVQTFAAGQIAAPVKLAVAGTRTQPGAVPVVSPVALSVSAQVLETAGAVMSASLSLSAGVVRTQPAASALLGPLTLSAAGVPTYMASGVLGAPVTLVAVGTTTRPGAVVVSAPAALVAGALRTTIVASALAGPVSLSVAAVRFSVLVGAASLNASPVLAVAGVATRQAVATITVAMALDAGVLRTTSGTASLSATVVLTDAATVMRFGTVALSAPLGIIVSTTSVALASTTMDAPVALSTVVTRTQFAAVSVSTAVTLSVSTLLGRFAAAELPAPVSLSAVPLLTRPASVSMTGSVALVVSAVLSRPGTAPMTAPVQVAVGASQNTTLVGAVVMSAPMSLAASVLVTRMVAASLTAPVRLTPDAVQGSTMAVAVSARLALSAGAVPGRTGVVPLASPLTLSSIAVLAVVATVDLAAPWDMRALARVQIPGMRRVLLRRDGRWLDRTPLVMDAQRNWMPYAVRVLD